MTTAVNKIACRSGTVCPPAIVLTLFIVDTMSFATVTLNQFVPGTNMAKSVDLIGCGTLVKPTINRFKQLLLL